MSMVCRVIIGARSIRSTLVRRYWPAVRIISATSYEWFMDTVHSTPRLPTRVIPESVAAG